MSIDHKVSFPEILYDFLTIYQYDTGSKAHIAYFQKNFKSSNAQIQLECDCKSGLSLVCKMKVKVAEYESKVI